MQAKLPETEAVRLEILRDYNILDTPLEAEFDDFTLLAAQLCGTPIALISLIDEERQWFKSHLGMDVPETCRDVAFCAHALHHTEVFLVPDAQKDPRFCDNPLVTGEPFVRFYAGAPLLTAGGHALGTLCVIDQEPRTLTPAQQDALQALARQVMARLELRRGIAARTRAERKLREGEALKAAILQSALDCVITINAEGRVIEWNPAAEITFGYRIAEVLGQDLTTLIIPEACREAHRRGMAHYLATSEGPVLGQRLEMMALRADGTELPIEFTITPVCLASGLVFTATLRDITARREAEEALHRAQEALEARVEERTRDLERLRYHNESLLLAAGEGIFGVDDTGKAMFVNPAAIRMLGWTQADLLGQPIHSLLHHTYTSGLPYPHEECRMRDVLASGESTRVNDEVFWRKDGTSFPVEYIATPLREDGLIRGVVITFQDISTRQRAQAHIHSLNAELTGAYDATIEGWSRALDLRDHETEGHSRRVTETTVHLAKALGVSDAEIVHIRRGALLHDIGKMGVPDSVLLKPGPLTEEEWVLMRRHPALAYEMLAPIEFLHPALDIPYCHHEKWDGSGYPRGLVGEDIPLAARLFAAVDIWDALSSDRPYRRAWAPPRVREHLRTLSGTHLDPTIVDAFLSLIDPAEMNTLLARAPSKSIPVLARAA